MEMSATTSSPEVIYVPDGPELTPDQRKTVEAMRNLDKAEVRGNPKYAGRVSIRAWKDGDWWTGPFLSTDGKFIDRVTLKEGKKLGMTREEVEARNEGYKERWQAWCVQLHGRKG
jgi:hypothetical protein